MSDSLDNLRPYHDVIQLDQRRRPKADKEISPAAQVFMEKFDQIFLDEITKRALEDENHVR